MILCRCLAPLFCEGVLIGHEVNHPLLKEKKRFLDGDTLRDATVFLHKTIRHGARICTKAHGYLVLFPGSIHLYDRSIYFSAGNPRDMSKALKQAEAALEHIMTSNLLLHSKPF